VIFGTVLRRSNNHRSHYHCVEGLEAGEQARAPCKVDQLWATH
jgi:hypothetical protein